MYIIYSMLYKYSPEPTMSKLFLRKTLALALASDDENRCGCWLEAEHKFLFILFIQLNWRISEISSEMYKFSYQTEAENI